METKVKYKTNGHTPTKVKGGIVPKPIHPMYLTHRERQLIARLRQMRNAGERRAEVEIEGDGPKVRED